MKRISILIALIFAVTSLSLFNVYARSPIGVMRSRANAVRAAVKKNVDIIIRPKLVIARGGAGAVSALALSSDERYLATAVGDHTLRLWDLNVGREIAILSGHKAKIINVVFHPDNKIVASVDIKGVVHLFDLKDPLESKAITPDLQNIRHIAFNKTGDLLITADLPGEVRLWDIKNRKVHLQFNLQASEMIAMQILSDGQYLVSAHADGQVNRYDLDSGTKLVTHQGHSKPIHVLAVGRLNNIVAGGDKNGHIYLWNFKDGALIRKIKGHKGAITALAFDEASGLWASGDAKGEVRLGGLKKGTEPKLLGKHNGSVNFVKIDKEGAHALSASEDGVTRLWNILSGKLLVSMISTKDGWAVVDAKGRFDGNQDALTGIEWQEGATKLPVNNFSEVYYQPALLAQAMQDTSGLKTVKSIPDGIHLPPKVEIINTGGSGSKTRAVKVKVTGADQGNSGVEEVRLYRNGKRINEKMAFKTDRKESKEGVVEIVKQYDLPLAPGRNVLNAVAINRERLESQPSTLIVSGEGDAAGSKLWLITIGINQYKNPELNLNYAEVDASAVQAFFTSEQRRFPFLQARVSHVTNQKATKQSILDLFRTLHHVAQQDIAVIYMAGHGVSADNEWYFVSHEIERPDKAAQLKQKGLSSKELKKEIEAIAANRVFLIIDACHSGGAVSPIKDFQGMKALRMMARSVGVHILAATDRDQFAVELSSFGHGIFTFSLLKGLDGKADKKEGDGAVSVQELMHYVEKTVPALSRRYANYAQFPTAHSRGYDFDIALPSK